MIILSHPTGNQFVRAILAALHKNKLLHAYFTTVGFSEEKKIPAYLPNRIQAEWERRRYTLPASKLKTFPFREAARWFSGRLHLNALTKHETGPFCVDAVYRSLDRRTASWLNSLSSNKGDRPQAVYAYEDGALETFQAAKSLGLKRIYELPIAYWETATKLLQEEADRLPSWKPTLESVHDSPSKFTRKTRELEEADTVICPSRFVYDSLPTFAKEKKQTLIAEFGSPNINPTLENFRPHPTKGKLRVLFAGSMSQRKGLADLFSAFQLLKRPDIELVVLGTPLCDLDFYRKQFPHFQYEPPRPHGEVLKLMSQCHLLALPSIVEGRALVQQEALACGLPLLVTPNAGGEDLIVEEKTGFLVPIRSPDKIAEKLTYLADHRTLLPDMSIAAQATARERSWDSYCSKIVKFLTKQIPN